MLAQICEQKEFVKLISQGTRFKCWRVVDQGGNANQFGEEFSTVTAAIHAAAAFPERWPEALLTVVHLLTSPRGEFCRDHGWQNVLANLDRLGVTALIVNANGTVHQQSD